MPREEIQRLCNVHLAVFREQLEKQKLDIPVGHPISILMEEHKIMLRAYALKHYLREENVFFPVLEKHGIRATFNNVDGA